MIPFVFNPSFLFGQQHHNVIASCHELGHGVGGQGCMLELCQIVQLLADHFCILTILVLSNVPEDGWHSGSGSLPHRRRHSCPYRAWNNGGLSGLFLSVFPEYSFIFRRLSGTFPQDFSVQYPPHMLRISVQIRQLQYIHPRCLFCDLRQGNSYKSNTAVFDLFQYFAFRTQFCFTLHDDVDPSSGTLLHQFCKTSALPSAASGCH